MNHAVSRIADAVTNFVGGVPGIAVVLSIVVLDLAWGYHAGYGSAWGNANGAATGLIGVVLLVFLQHAANRASAAMNLKIDELVLANAGASNKAIGSERLEETAIALLEADVLARARAEGD